jgi:Rod binding domain-containing protein
MTAPVSASSAMLETTPEPKPTKAADAAKQFEALLINQMLRSVRDASAEEDDDSGKSTMLDIADQQFSKLLANNGGMGLARMIVAGLNTTPVSEP